MDSGEVRGELQADWPELAAALTHSEDDNVDPDGHRLLYAEMTTTAYFLADRLRAGETSRVATFFKTVERCLLEGDGPAIELIVVGLLEDVQNQNITRLDMDAWLPYLGPTTFRAWKAVKAFWGGSAQALRPWVAE